MDDFIENPFPSRPHVIFRQVKQRVDRSLEQLSPKGDLTSELWLDILKLMWLAQLLPPHLKKAELTVLVSKIPLKKMVLNRLLKKTLNMHNVWEDGRWIPEFAPFLDWLFHEKIIEPDVGQIFLEWLLSSDQKDFYRLFFQQWPDAPCTVTRPLMKSWFDKHGYDWFEWAVDEGCLSEILETWAEWDLILDIGVACESLQWKSYLEKHSLLVSSWAELTRKGVEFGWFSENDCLIFLAYWTTTVNMLNEDVTSSWAKLVEHVPEDSPWWSWLLKGWQILLLGRRRLPEFVAGSKVRSVHHLLACLAAIKNPRVHELTWEIFGLALKSVLLRTPSSWDLDGEWDVLLQLIFRNVTSRSFQGEMKSRYYQLWRSWLERKLATLRPILPDVGHSLLEIICLEWPDLNVPVEWILGTSRVLRAFVPPSEVPNLLESLEYILSQSSRLPDEVKNIMMNDWSYSMF